MAGPRSRASTIASTDESGGPARPATWIDWFAAVQAFQLHVVRDALVAWNHQVAALGSVRDMQSLTTANQSAIADWEACLDGIHREWLALAKAIPPDALAAAGWQLRPGASEAAAADGASKAPDPVEQARLGFEMLMRPWLPAFDLDHTDEFVA